MLYWPGTLIGHRVLRPRHTLPNVVVSRCLAAHIETFLREHGHLIDPTALRGYLTNRDRDNDGVDINIDIDHCPPGTQRNARLIKLDEYRR